MEYLIAYYNAGEQISNKVINSIDVLTTIRTKLLLEGFITQLDRDGLEFLNPINNQSVIII